MKAILVLAVLALFPGCGKNLRDQVRESVRTLDNASLSKKDVEIIEVRETGDLAIAEVKVRTALKLRRKDDGWVLEEIRIGDRRWEKAAHILAAIDEKRTETTRSLLKKLADGIAAYAAEKGGVPPASDFEGLMNELAPRHLNPPIRLDAWSNPFSYQRISNYVYDLRSAGPDGQFQTADDLSARGLEK